MIQWNRFAGVCVQAVQSKLDAIPERWLLGQGRIQVPLCARLFSLGLKGTEEDSEAHFGRSGVVFFVLRRWEIWCRFLLRDDNRRLIWISAILRIK